MLTLGGVLGASLLGGSLGGAILTYIMQKSKFKYEQTKDAWELNQISFEKEIELRDRLGESEQADQLRRDYAEQQAAWRAMQGVSALSPREISTQSQSTLTEDELEQLRQLLSNASLLAPGYLSAEDLFSRANGYYSTGRYQDALTDYNRSLELRPDDPATLMNRGVSLERLGRLDDALTDYNRSLELRPDQPDTLNNRGNTLRQLERYDDALDSFNRSLEFRPVRPGTLTNRGVVHHYLGRLDDALTDFNRSLDLRPDDPGTTYNIACNFSLRGRYQDSLEWLEKAISLDSNNRRDAINDEDFASLKADPEFGPKFWQLVGGDTEN